MNSLKYYFILTLFIPLSLTAQTEPLAYGARAVGLGNAFVGVRGEFWSLFHNPAGIGGIETPAGGLFFEQRYLLSEINNGGMGFVYPFADRQAAGLQIYSLNVSTYSEIRAGLTYGIAFFEKLSLGAQVNYKSFQIEEFGNTSAFFVDVGLNVQVTDDLSLGFTGTNVNRVQLKAQTLREDLATRISAGLAYRPTSKVMFVADLQKEVDRNVSFRGGVEYWINDYLIARIGMSNEPLTLNGGFGIAFKQFFLDAALAFHESLGYTPYISLSYVFSKNNPEDTE